MCVVLNVSFNGEYALLDLDLKSYNIKFLIKILKKKYFSRSKAIDIHIGYLFLVHFHYVKDTGFAQKILNLPPPITRKRNNLSTLSQQIARKH